MNEATDMHDQSQPQAVDPADVAIARDEARLRRRRRIRIAVVVLGMLVGYVLSPGPLFKLLDEGTLPNSFEPVVEFLLWPLEAACENFTVVERFYVAYLHLFGGNQ